MHNLSVIRDLHGYKFAPLICDTLHLLAELDIQMLWSQKPGAIFSEGGDIDNRLKTLFDALKIPKERGELPDGATPAADEIPFFSLVDDDRLISRVTVETDRLLDDVASRSEVALLIRVRTRTVKTVLGTLGLF